MGAAMSYSWTGPKWQAVIFGDNGEYVALELEEYDPNVLEGEIVPDGDISLTDLIDSHMEHEQAISEYYDE